MASLQKFFFGARLTVVLLQLLIVSSNLIINRAVVAGEVDSPVVTITSTTAASPMPAAAPAPAAADSENKFLKYLFNKYGSKGVISFEVSCEPNFERCRAVPFELWCALGHRRVSLK